MYKFLKIIISLALAFSFCLISTDAVSAKAAVVINGDTGEILYQINADTRMPMASTTKIMTALLLCELAGDFEKQITVTSEMVAVEGSSMGLLAGDKVTYHDLLYGMMLASGNDAANTAAIALGGSVENFVKLMNERAASLGLTDTNFVTPSGLDAQDHYTTAYELAVIARAALHNEHFAAAAASKSATLCYGNPPYKRTLTNHNRLLKLYDDVIGVKTGFTKKSGRCLVSAAKKDGKFVIAVTLCDPDDWSDHRQLLDIGYACLNEYTVNPDEEDFSIPTVCGTGIKVRIPSVSFFALHDREVTTEIISNHFLYPEINAGESVGSLRCYADGVFIKEVPLVAENSVAARDENIISILIEIMKNLLY